MTENISYTKNEYGIAVVHLKCKTCGVDFSICPAPKEKDLPLHENCTAPDCESYDPERDTDVLFMTDKEFANHHKLVSFNRLKDRRDIKNGKSIIEVLERK